MKVLVLGGTTEASQLTRMLAGDARFEVMLSLAGRTANPVAQPVPTRVGGFGGAEGLVAFLREQGFAALIDATHPFAQRMSRHAAEASRLAGIPSLLILRPPWMRHPGDQWQVVPTMDEAAARLGAEKRRVFLT